MKLVLLLCCALLSGCVGAVVFFPDVVSHTSPGLALGAQRGKILRHPPTTEKYNKEKVTNLWGTPDLVVSTEHGERWHYARGFTWSGILLFVIVPIPLMAPVGHSHTALEFEGSELINIEEDREWSFGGVCGFRPHLWLDCEGALPNKRFQPTSSLREVASEPVR